jgi:hypothetical protein
MLSTSVLSTEDSLASLRATPMSWLLGGECDPPIPPGATKFSYSARLGDMKARLCDTDLDFLELKVCVETLKFIFLNFNILFFFFF